MENWKHWLAMSWSVSQERSVKLEKHSTRMAHRSPFLQLQEKRNTTSRAPKYGRRCYANAGMLSIGVKPRALSRTTAKRHLCLSPHNYISRRLRLLDSRAEVTNDGFRKENDFGCCRWHRAN